MCTAHVPPCCCNSEFLQQNNDVFCIVLNRLSPLYSRDNAKTKYILFYYNAWNIFKFQQTNIEWYYEVVIQMPGFFRPLGQIMFFMVHYPLHTNITLIYWIKTANHQVNFIYSQRNVFFFLRRPKKYNIFYTDCISWNNKVKSCAK